MHPDRFAALSRSLGDSTSRRGLLRLLGVGVAGTAITAVGISEAQAERKKEKQARSKKVRAQAKPGGSETTDVIGTVNRAVYEGTLTITRFSAQGGELVALGTLSGAAAAAGQIEIPVDLAA